MMLAQDSGLLEAFREDRYRDATDINSISMMSSHELTDDPDLGQPVLFRMLLEDCDYFWKCEEPYIQAVAANGSSRKYDDLFGESRMTGHLLQGVKNSLDFSGKMHDVRDIYNILAENVYRPWSEIYVPTTEDADTTES